MVCDIYNYILKRFVAGALALALAFPSTYVHAQVVALPPAGDKVGLSQAFEPAILSAVSVDPENPLEFQFYIDPGQSSTGGSSRDEYLFLIKDFMTSLTVPQGQLWVNLSPYEKDRIIDDRFGLTDMGRDLLAQDYMLKQITASLIYPEEGVGRDFWAEVYSRAQDQFGTTDIPLDTFNKVWIMPDIAEVYQKGTSAVVLKAHLKVMLEADYLATENNLAVGAVVSSEVNAAHELTKQILRQVVIPVLEKEVNEGKNFARLRQIYNALILGAWYKKTMRESFLGKAYVDQSKVNGIEQQDQGENLRIYGQYVEAFRKGVFNYVKEEIDRYSGEVIPRKYLAGGFALPLDFAENIKVYEGDDKFYEIPKQTCFSIRAIFHGIKNQLVPEKVHPILDQYTKDFKEIKEVAQTIAGYDDEKTKVFQRNTDKELLAGKVKDLFHRILAEEEKKDEVISTIDQIIDGKQSGLKALLLSGEHTESVMKVLLGMTRFSRDAEDADVFKDILSLLGLKSEDLTAQMASIILHIKSLDEYKELYGELLQQMYLLPEKTKTVLDVKDIKESRQFRGWKVQHGYYPANPAAQISEDEWVGHVMGQQATRYKDGLNFINKVIRKFLPPDVIDGGVGAIRAKGRASLKGKLEKVDENGVREKLPQDIFDLIAARFSFMDLRSMTNAAYAMRENSISVDSFIKDYEELKHRLEVKRNALIKQGNADEVGKVSLQISEIQDKLKNFRDDQDGLVLYSFKNSFNRSEGWPDWYEAIHMVPVVGNNDETIEIQLKVLDLSVLQDLEHILKYKNNGKESPLYPDLIKFMWVTKSIVMMNYLLGVGDPKNVAIVIDNFMKAKGIDASETTGSQAKQDVRSTGGIDVRNVEGAIDITGPRGEFLVGAGRYLPVDVSGFYPEIIGISSLSKLPFLQEQPLSQGVFSRN